MPPSRKMLGNKRLLQPFVPSSLDILSNRRPAKLSLYDPLRYGVLSSDDRYIVLVVLSTERCHYITEAADTQVLLSSTLFINRKSVFSYRETGTALVVLFLIPRHPGIKKKQQRKCFITAYTFCVLWKTGWFHEKSSRFHLFCGITAMRKPRTGPGTSLLHRSRPA